MQDIKLNLALEDVNLILEGLGNLPYAKVYTLVAKIQEQAARQLEAVRTAAGGPAAAGG